MFLDFKKFGNEVEMQQTDEIASIELLTTNRNLFSFKKEQMSAELLFFLPPYTNLFSCFSLEFSEVFDTFDRDKDGSLDKSDFETAIRSLGMIFKLLLNSFEI